MPELPEARRKRMSAEYDITAQDAQTLTATRAFADRFEAAAKQAKSPKRVANPILGELLLAVLRPRISNLNSHRSP
jgi:aspartyl-tRNA(Asn)/glutamyl-tRNA(Gln) amidotransferase subunit B